MLGLAVFSFPDTLGKVIIPSALSIGIRHSSTNITASCLPKINLQEKVAFQISV